jgi:hypothetical protein
MKRNDKDELSIRRYLLGYSSGEEQEQLEEHVITDSEYREQVLVIEDGLIEDYLANDLSEEDRKRFVEHFLSTPQQMQKLKIAEALNKYFSVEAAAHSPPLTPESPQPTGAEPLRASFLRRNPLAAFALAAAVLLVVFGGAWLLIDRWRGHGPVVQEQERDREFQRELERLNKPQGSNGSPSTPEPPKAEALTLTLSPVTLRGGGDLPVVVLPTRADAMELLLVLPAGEYKSYRVVLQKSGDAPRFTVDRLAAGTTESGKAVILKIPIKYLSRGDYILELSGSNAEGRFEPAGGYSFRVLD